VFVEINRLDLATALVAASRKAVPPAETDGLAASHVVGVSVAVLPPGSLTVLRRATMLAMIAVPVLEIDSRDELTAPAQDVGMMEAELLVFPLAVMSGLVVVALSARASE
jgi:hypothetical protein